jgi:hypothetical protein
MKMYCVKCGKKTESEGVYLARTSNGRDMEKSTCADCGTTKTLLIKHSDALALARTLGKAKGSKKSSKKASKRKSKKSKKMSRTKKSKKSSKKSTKKRSRKGSK